MIEVGDRVVCVDDSMQPHTIEELKQDFPNWVKKDKNYTIEEIIEYDFGPVAVILKEVRNPMKFFKVVNRVQEPAFLISRFRKLETQEATVEEEVEETIEI